MFNFLIIYQARFFSWVFLYFSCQSHLHMRLIMLVKSLICINVSFSRFLKDWKKRKPKVIHSSRSSSVVTTATSTIPVPTSSLVSFSSFTSMTIFPTIDFIASTSSVLISKHTPNVKDPPSIRTTSTKEGDSGVDNVLDPFQEGQVNSATKNAAGSLGIAGTLFMWLLFMQGIWITFKVLLRPKINSAFSLYFKTM